MAEMSIQQHKNHNGKRAKGGLITMPFIFANEVCEKLAVVGFQTNMISYLTLQIHMPITKAANTLTNFGGTASLTPLLGAFIADSFAGRFWTITVASIIYQIGMISLTVSAVVPKLRPPPCQNGQVCQEANTGQVAILYISLLLTAIGSGGIRPCVVAFGADQFDETDEKQKASTWKFFNWYYFCMGVSMLVPTPYVDHQKAVTIRNDVNLKKESLKIEADDQNPGKFLVSFTFDAAVACSITIYFFAKEGEGCNLTTVKEDSMPPITISFQQGLGQKFRQTPGTGIDLSTYEESELSKGIETGVYPLAVKAEATLSLSEDGKQVPGISNSQITDAVFEKVKGEYKVKVVKQILWVNEIRYELQEIYGIGNSVEGGDFDANDPGKECVICLSEPRDTTVLPCRHMCMCNGCAKVLRFQTNRCPICRQPIERLLEIKVNKGAED